MNKIISVTIALALLVATSISAQNVTGTAGGSDFTYTYTEVADSPDAVTIINPSNFNGSWLFVPNFGGSADETNTFDSVVSQKENYTNAKASGDVQTTVNNALWPWVQGWALFNAGKKLANATKYAEAVPYFKQAIRVVLGAPDPDSRVPQANVTEATRQTKWVVNVSASYLLYCERNLGLKAWPKASK